MDCIQYRKQLKYIKYANGYCKYIVCSFIREIERTNTFYYPIPQTIIDICLLFYYQHYLKLDNMSQATPFTMLFTIYNAKLLLQINPFQSIDIKTQCDCLYQHKIDTKYRCDDVLHNLIHNEQELSYIKNNKHIYQRIKCMLSTYHKQTESLNLHNIIQWTDHDILLSFIYHIINFTRGKFRYRAKVWEFINYLHNYFNEMQYDGNAFLAHYVTSITKKLIRNARPGKGYGLQMMKIVCCKYSLKSGQYSKVKKSLNIWADNIYEQQQNPVSFPWSNNWISSKYIVDAFIHDIQTNYHILVHDDILNLCLRFYNPNDETQLLFNIEILYDQWTHMCPYTKFDKSTLLSIFAQIFPYNEISTISLYANKGCVNGSNGVFILLSIDGIIKYDMRKLNLLLKQYNVGVVSSCVINQLTRIELHDNAWSFIERCYPKYHVNFLMSFDATFHNYKATPFTLLFSVFNKHQLLRMTGWQTIPIKTQCEYLQHVKFNNKNTANKKYFNFIDEEYSEFINNQIQLVSDKYHKICSLLEMKCISEWSSCDVIISFMYFVINEASTYKCNEVNERVWIFMDYLYKYFKDVQYNGNDLNCGKVHQKNGSGFGLKMTIMICGRYQLKTGQFIKVKKMLCQWKDKINSAMPLNRSKRISK